MRITNLYAGKFAKELLAIGLVLGTLQCVTNVSISAKTTSKSKSESKSESSSKSESKKDEDKKSSEKDRDEDAGEGKSSSDDESKSSNDKEETDDSSSDSKAAEETPNALTPQNLAGRLSEILSPASKSSEWGVKVMVAETGQTLFESQAEEGFIPASNRKLFTGALALDQLGPDFVFRTYLYYTGKIDAQGTLNGNLVIIPSGDPTFSTTLYKAAHPDWVFRDWAQKVQAAGIKSVTGDLLVDCSAWNMADLTPQGWPARVINDSYAPQTSPLTINENLCNIILTPGKKGQPAAVSFSPPATGYPVTNLTVSGKSGSPIAKRIVNKTIEIHGGVPENRTIWSFPIDRPTLFAAANFRNHLMDGKVPIMGSVRIITSPNVIPARSNANTLAMVESPKLSDIVSYMMKKSDNHMAEQLYVSVSAAKLGKGSYTNSHNLENDLLLRAKIDPNSFHCYDGCGLSEANRVTPTQICKLLTFMRSHPYAQQYYDSMSVSGRDGTLRNRMSRIAGRVHAKTGTINGVKTLSGYLSLSPTQTISFSFLVNQIKGGSVSGVQDRLCSTLASLVL